MKGKKVGGVWLPENETHFVEMMLNNPRRQRMINGKATYQYHKLEYAMQVQPAGRFGICVDVGAHVGLWSMWLTDFFDRVVAFEPVKDFRTLFKRNVDMTNVELEPYALGTEEKTVEIVVPDEQTGAAYVNHGGDHPRAKYSSSDKRDVYDNVKMVVFDQYWEEREYEAGATLRVDFIKIDVEGYELNVVQGMEQILRRDKPNIVVEQKGNEGPFGHEHRAAQRFLTKLGARDVRVMAGDHIMAW